jgi:hypothetical protein
MFARLVTIFTLFALTAGAALADTDGTAGIVGHIRENLAGSDTYGYYHGYVSIAGVGFYWGGTYCPGITAPTDEQVALLLTARIEGLTVNPWYKTPYSASYYCLTNFETY